MLLSTRPLSHGLALLALGLLGPATPLGAQATGSFSPGEVSYLGKTPFRIAGAYPSDTTVTIGPTRVGDAMIGRDEVSGTVPSYTGRETLPVTVDVVLTWERGREILTDAVTYLGPLEILRNTPETAPAAGGSVITVLGVGFTPETEVLLGGSTVGEVTLEDARTLSFVAPAHPAGSYDLTVRDRSALGSILTSTLPDALTYEREPEPELSGVTPFHVSTRGDTPIEIRGRDFTSAMELFVVGPPELPIDFELAGPGLAHAVAPARQTAGIVDLGVRSTAGAAPVFLRRALEYISPSSPAPQDVEGTLVDGQAEVEWVNPVPYDRVHVYRDGELHATLNGDVSLFRDPSPVAGDRVDYRLVGESDSGLSGLAKFIVAINDCDPPVGFWGGDRGEKDFRIYGGHDPLLARADVKDVNSGDASPPIVGDYTYSIVDIDAITHQPAVSYILPDVLDLPANELVTGFRLLEATKKLRVGLHGARIAQGENLSLRVLIQSVAGGTDGPDREVELTFPRVPVDPFHRWMEVAYNADKPALPGEPFPDPDKPQPPDDPLPPGDYLVKIYAVGGDTSQAYFTVSSDNSPDQIPVPGVDCPPYPLVRVEPVRNFNPEILDIESVGEPEPFVLPYIDEDGNPVPVLKITLEAEVDDLDGDLITGYKWSIFNGLEYRSAETATNTWQVSVVGYGTYNVFLTVEDHRCGKTTDNILVTVHPPCLPAGPGPRFTYPSPVPSRLHYVTDLTALTSFEEELPGTFRIFVVDQSGCESPAATTQVQAGLFRPGETQPIQLTDGNPAVVDACLQGVAANRECCVTQIVDEDLGIGLDENGAVCNFETNGGRFWIARFDMRRLPEVGAESGSYELRARGFHTTTSQPAGVWGAWRGVFDFGADQKVVRGSSRIHVYDKPAYLGGSGYTSGSYEASIQTYSFTGAMAPPGTGGPIYQSEPVPLEHPEIDAVGELPASSNGVSSAEQTAFIDFQKGVWSLEAVQKGYEAYALGSRIYDSGIIGGAQAKSLRLDGPRPKGLGDLDALGFEDCDYRQLINESFEFPIFDAPVFVDPLTGGVIFKLSFSMSVGGFFGVGVGNRIALDPFPVPGEDPFQAQLWLSSTGGFYVGAALNADILLGFVGVSAGIDVNVYYLAPFVIDAANLGNPQFGIDTRVGVVVWIEGCVAWVFCASEEKTIFDEPILRVPDSATVQQLNGEVAALSVCAKKKDAPGSPTPIDKGPAGEPVQLNTPTHQLSIASSADGWYQVAVGRDEAKRLFYLQRTSTFAWLWPPREVSLPFAQHEEYSGGQSDPEVVFLDNDTVLLAWTQDFSREDPELDGITPADLASPDIVNAVTRRSEIVYSIGEWKLAPDIPVPDPPATSFFIEWSAAQRLTDDQGPDGYRADGKVSLARDPTTGDIWTTWVRYETPDMIQPDGVGEPAVQLRQTSIYARRITGGQPGPILKVSDATPQIDVQPDIAVAPDGTAFIVWLHDFLHEDLISANDGRNVLYSRFEPVGGQWSAPAPVIVDPSGLPGLLDPDLALAAGGNGMLAFTAMPPDVNVSDAGLGNLRMLYTVTLADASGTPQWGDPVLVREVCDTPIFAYGPKVKPLVTILGNESAKFALFAQETGPAGSRKSAGNALVSTYDASSQRWTAPRSLTPDDRVHQDISATVTSRGEIVLMHQSPFPALRDEAIAELEARRRKGDVDEEPRSVSGGELFGDLLGQSFPTVADPGIHACRLSDAFAGPGSRITASVVIGNRGFATTPTDQNGQSTLYVMLFHDRDGVLEPVAEEQVPPLAPGAEATLELDLTVPREPVRLVARVDGVEGELDPGDNLRDCLLGAPPPHDLTCDAGRTAAGTAVVALRWTNTALYESIQVYRDDRMLTELPGESTSYTDAAPGFDDRTGMVDEHEYAIRGVIGESRSGRSISCRADVSLPPAPDRFLRADANGDLRIDISDPMFTLFYHFLGRRSPDCLAAADANGDGLIDISDAIFSLEYLYLRGPRPPAPFPSCGETGRESDERLGCDRPRC